MDLPRIGMQFMTARRYRYLENCSVSESESNPVEDAIREAFGRVSYTHKTHEKDRERLTKKATHMKWTNVILNAITFGGVLTAITTQTQGGLFISLVFAMLSAGFTLYQLSFNPQEEAQQHRVAAKRLLALRNEYINLLADVVGGTMGVEAIRDRRDALEREAQKVFVEAPDSSSKAYLAAQKALKADEEMTFSDEELDRMLPRGMRRVWGR